jgi:uncharacterized protein YndB with AHSA1/START domain
MTEAGLLIATIRIEATPEEVFPYLVDPGLIVEWIGISAELQPEPGGLFALEMTGVAVRGNYLAVEPPNRVVFTWGTPGNEDLPEGSTTVEIVLTADAGATNVQLTHHGLSETQRPKHAGGWAECLARLAEAARA